MPWWGILLIIISTFIVFSISMCIGAATLTGVNLLSGITGVYIPVSLLSVLVSVIGGVPGVTLLLTLNLFF